jgi:hypothetical protein
MPTLSPTFQSTVEKQRELIRTRRTRKFSERFVRKEGKAGSTCFDTEFVIRKVQKAGEKWQNWSKLRATRLGKKNEIDGCGGSTQGMRSRVEKKVIPAGC